MNFFRKKYSVCRECGVHFEPVTGEQAELGYLCAIHRKPVWEETQRKLKVLRWAEYHWKRLEDQMKEELKESDEKHRAAAEAYNLASQASKMQNAAMQGAYIFRGQTAWHP